jgi:hypothetical protein
VNFIVQVLFQWKGITDGLKEDYEKLKKAINEVDGVKFLGLYGPTNERWNWVYIFEVKERHKFWNAMDNWSELRGGRPKQLTNLIIRWYRKREP